MTRRSAGLRFFAALVAILGLAVFDLSRAVAQDEAVASDEEVAAAEEGVAPAEEPPADWVAVSCGANPDAGTTACVFTATLGSGAVIDALTVRFDQVCGAAVIDAGGAEAGDAGYRAAGSPTVSLLLTGLFDVSADLTTYTVESGGVATEVAGNALACAPPPQPDPPAPTTADVLVSAYYCPTGAGDVAGVLPADCYVAAGIAFSATADGADLGGFVTDDGGAATVTAPLGATLTLVEDPATVATGFAALGDGTATVAPVTDGAGASLVHVPVAGGGDEETPPPGPGGDNGETTGRIQLVRGTCRTSDTRRTELTVIDPRSFSVRAQADDGCQPLGTATFLITGASLPQGETEVTTEPDGSWRGTLLPGIYTVTVTDIGSGEPVEVEVEVVDDGIVVVVAMDYEPFEETGRIAVRRYACVDPNLDAPTTAIETVFNPPDEPSAGDESCKPEDGDFQLNDGDPFDGGGDGAISFDLPTGSYVFTDLDSGVKNLNVGIEAAATTYVVVRHWLPEGWLTVLYSFCAAANAHTVSPTDAGYFAENCTATAGVELVLLDAAGNVIGTALTDENGIARWTNLPAGTYLIRGVGSSATCAVFVAQVPSLGGFALLANTIYQGAVYGCIKPAPGDGSGGGNNGGGNNGGNTGGDGTGGLPNPDVVAGGDTGTNGAPLVTTLPMTGVAGATEQPGLPVGLLAAAVAAVALAVWTGWTGRRRLVHVRVGVRNRMPRR
jgi:hypothetical protein